MNSGHYNVHTPIALFSSASTYASTTPLFMTVMASSNRFSLVSSAGVLHSVFHVYISYPIPRKEIISYNLTVILQHHSLDIISYINVVNHVFSCPIYP